MRFISVGTVSRFLAVGFAFCVMFSATVAHAQGMQAAGVEIDAENVMRMKTFYEPSLQAFKERQKAAAKSLPQNLVKYTDARCVSLTRLEHEVAKAENGVVPEEVLYMAGLQKIDHVLVYPESGDVVLVGPAEGWFKDASGRVVGLTTGKPVLHLKDLVAAMRAFPAGKKDSPLIGCSIDPTAEGLANMQTFLTQVGRTARPGDTARIVNGLRSSLGHQDVTVMGVNPDTRYARTLVEADYRMKLIGIGLEQPPVRMASFVQSVSPAQVSRNALFRWYFVPEYECIRMSPDKLAISLEGQGVKLVGADELVSRDGSRQETVAVSGGASKAFTDAFTQKYPEISAKAPVYAELRNLVDMAVVAAYLQSEDIYGKLDWSMVVFGNESRFPIQTEKAPKKVESAVAAIWRGKTLMTPIGGGVEIRAANALKKDNLLNAKDPAVAQKKAETESRLPEEGWWWN